MTISECAAWLKNTDNFLLVTHLRPDGDSIGSACALCLALRSMGKEAYLYNNPQILENYIDYTRGLYAPPDFHPSAVITVDLASPSLFPLGFDSPVDLSVDHHSSNTYYAEDTLLDGSRAACGELVMDLILELTGGITSEMAELLYIAVSTDTGCFGYNNTTAEALRAAAKLIDFGADNAKINKRVFRSSTMPRLMLEGMVYQGLAVHNGGIIAIATVTLEMMEKSGATENDCEDLASLSGRLIGTKVGVTIREVEENVCKISVRTAQGIDANNICSKYGGGGHPMAGGCTLYCGHEEAAAKMLEAVREELG